jgi:hypothetical protein
MKFCNKIILLFGVIFCAISGVASAAVVDFSTFNSITTIMVNFLNDVDVVMAAVFASGEISAFVFRLWTFFSILLISYFCFDYIFGKVTLGDLIGLILTIGITKVLITYYDSITTAFWGWSVGFAEGIQMAAFGNTDLFFLPSYIFNACKSFSLPGGSIFTTNFAYFFALGLVMILIVLLSVGALLTATWAIWGYALAKMIGWMFIPTLMFERLEWLFNGWLRFFFGMLLYGVIARINLVLVALVMNQVVGGGPISPTATPAMQISLSGLMDVAGLIAFLLMGFLALVSTGRFASAIAGGSGGSGGGGVVMMAVRFASGKLK